MRRTMSTASLVLAPLLFGVACLGGCDLDAGTSRAPSNAASAPASSPSTPGRSRTPALPDADGSIYLAADPRGGDALTDPLSARQAELHPEPSDIYLSRRGEPVRRVVSTDGADRCPRVSPDGDRLAYLQDASLVVAPLDAAGRPAAPRVRTRPPASPSGCPEWSPDGRSVGYVAVLGDPNTPLYTARPAEVHAVARGGRDRVVASFEVQAWHQPAFAWSPRGNAVAYTTEAGIWRAPLGGQPELLWRPDAGDPSQELPMAYDRPTSLSWSPGGTIAFTVYASEPDEPGNAYGRGSATWTVRVIDPGSRRVERVGAIAGTDEGGGVPAWSPDGDRLAFRGPDGAIRLHDRISGSTTRVTPPGGRRVGYGDVAWSPEGDQLMTFTRTPARGYALVSIAVDGSATERRTPRTWALDWIGLDDVDWSGR